jgi:membrane protease YdiL (CAAX protease family)
MSSFESPAAPAAPAPSPAPPPRRVWKFFGTSLWGLPIFAALFAGQMMVVGYFVLSRGASADLGLVKAVLSSGIAISMSVITGFPAVLAALWLATRMARMPFADYLALRWTSWSNVLLGIVALAVLVAGWDLLSRALGREVAPGFMVEVLKSARADGALWLLVLAFCVVAPATEEFFARGFLYRGWSESRCGRPEPSCCRRWYGPRCICNTICSFSARCFPSGYCSAISVIAAIRPG